MLRLAHALSICFPLRLQVLLVRCIAAPLSLRALWKPHPYFLLHRVETFRERFQYTYTQTIGVLDRYLWRIGDPVRLSQFVRCEGKEHLEAARQKNDGVVFISVHHSYVPPFFYWGLASLPCSFTMVRAPTETGTTSLYDVFFTMKFKEEKDMFLTRGKNMKEVIQKLHGGGACFLLQDEKYGCNDPVPFLGVNIPLALGSLRLAKLGKARIIPCMMSGASGVLAAKPWAITFYESIDPTLPDAQEKVLAALENIVHTQPALFERWDVIASHA